MMNIKYIIILLHEINLKTRKSALYIIILKRTNEKSHQQSSLKQRAFHMNFIKILLLEHKLTLVMILSAHVTNACVSHPA